MEPSTPAEPTLDTATPQRPVALGRYDVIERIGSGGMGTVYAARDRERGSVVAIKTLPRADAAASLRLKREFRVVADMAHPNLAPVYELVEEDGLWFFAMARVEGVSFTEWARTEPDDDGNEWTFSRTLETPFEVSTGGGATHDLHRSFVGVENPAATVPPRRSMDALRRAFGELARGIAALHAVGLFHGDLKPSNVLVAEDGRVVLVDFGLSGYRWEQARAGVHMAGTPMYMLPEHLTGGLEDGAAGDWYALGVLMYRVLTGWMPFATNSMLDLLFKKRHVIPTAPDEHVPDVPLDLSDLCVRMLAPSPEERPLPDEIAAVLGVADESPVSLASSARSERHPNPHFVGRVRELEELERAYGSCRQNAMVVVHCCGPSGIGKSALLASFVSGVEQLDGALVLRGRCYERENVPFNAFDRIVDELAQHLAATDHRGLEEILPVWTAELATVFPAFTTVFSVRRRVAEAHLPTDPRELRRRAWVAMAELLATLREDQVIVLAIDDVQWADEDSAQLLMELIGRPQPPPLLLVMSYRPEAHDNRALERFFAMSDELGAEGRKVELTLDALPPRDAETLARAALERVGMASDDERVRYVAEEARGVPFFIGELAHFVATRGDLTEGVSLESALRARIGALPAEQRAIMGTVAVAGSPLPQSLVFEAAGIDADGLPGLLALRSSSLVSWLGAGADDLVAPYHDRIRESASAAMEETDRQATHIALARALARRHDRDPSGAWVFEAVRHFAAARDRVEGRAERLRAARLHGEAASRARSTAAFPLASSLYDDAVSFLPDDAWAKHYGLALSVHTGAAEAAYLIGAWDALAQRLADVKAHARNANDQMTARQVEIDAHIGRQNYAAAVDASVEALGLLGIDLPADPEEAEVGAAVVEVLELLTEIGPEAFESLGDASDPQVLAAMRIQVRTSPAAYFNRPLLLPVLACNLIKMSVESGLSNVTPFALALFGIVLNTQEMFPVAHTWGRLALRLLDRYPDQTLVAASRHVLLNLVTCWMAPLHTILAGSREVFDIGYRTGDFEYGCYAAHAYTHNALYAGRGLGPLYDEVEELTGQMRALGQVNALHVHTPFVQLLKALTGRLDEPGILDDETFTEEASFAEADALGSQSGAFIIRYVVGVTRLLFGRPGEAVHHLEEAKARLDASPSVWHVPMLHQYFVVAVAEAARAGATIGPERMEEARDSVAALERLAGHHEGNFGHRATLARGALLQLDGDPEGARALFEEARRAASDGGWIADVALALELVATTHEEPRAARAALQRAVEVYERWGAMGMVLHLQRKLAD